MQNKKLLISIVIFSFLLFFTSIIKNKTRVIEKNINNLERKISYVEKSYTKVNSIFIIYHPQKCFKIKYLF